MTAAPIVTGHVPVRVAVPADASAEWIETVLPGRSFEVVRCATVDALAQAPTDLAVAWAEVNEAAPLLERFARARGATPLTLFVGGEPGTHPQARLMRALVQAKREWEAAFDALLEPMALLDTKGRVVRANQGFARVLGRDVAELRGLTAAELLGAAEEGEDPLPACLGDGAPRSAEVRYVGLRAPHAVSLSPVRGADGAWAGLVLLLKDLSAQREAQERMLQAARLLEVGHLAAGVAHEINTPLASIALRTESLRKAAEDTTLKAVPAFANFSRYLRTIEEETFRCKKIVRALLEFSARRQPEKLPFDVNALLDRTADLVEHQFRVQQVRLERQLEASVAPMAGDEGQIRQVVVALLMNALDASTSGGRVVLRLARPDLSTIWFAVEDDGRGIPPEIQGRIFDPFFTTKPFGQGTGLGLSICHGIIKAHAGAIRVDSAPGRGTRMAVTLPGLRQEVAS